MGLEFGALALSVALTELVYATAAIYDFLFAGVKRMAIGADLYIEIAGKRRSGHESVPTVAGYIDIAVGWVNIWFHGSSVQFFAAREHTARIAETQG